MILGFGMWGLCLCSKWRGSHIELSLFYAQLVPLFKVHKHVCMYIYICILHIYPFIFCVFAAHRMFIFLAWNHMLTNHWTQHVNCPSCQRKENAWGFLWGLIWRHTDLSMGTIPNWWVYGDSWGFVTHGKQLIHLTLTLPMLTLENLFSEINFFCWHNAKASSHLEHQGHGQIALVASWEPGPVQPQQKKRWISLALVHFHQGWQEWCKVINWCQPKKTHEIIFMQRTTIQRLGCSFSP